MYHNDYNLRQLLELALRVPEVGAVNFNILYYILRTIIEKQGLERVKPDFRLKGPLIAEINVEKSKSDVSIKRSLSAESLQTTKASEVSVVSKDSPKTNAEDSSENQSTKWNTLMLDKRIHAVEEEIGEFHILIAQLIDKIANFERVSGLQETRFMKEIADLQLSIKSNVEIQNLARELRSLSSDVSTLKLKEILKSGSEGEESSDQEIYDSTKPRIGTKPVKDESKVKIKKPVHPKKKEQEIKLPDKYEMLFDEVNDIKKYLKLEPFDYIAEKTVKPSVDEHEISKGKAKEDREITKKDKGKTEEDQEKAEGQEEAEEGKAQIEKDRGISERSKRYEDDERSAEDRVQTEKDFRKSGTDVGGAKKKDSIIEEGFTKIDVELLNISAHLNRLMEKCAANDKMFSSDINILKEKNLIMEQTVNKCDVEMVALKNHWDEMVLDFEHIKDNIQFIENQTTTLTDLPGLQNRVEQLEGYVYTEYEDGSEGEGEEEEKRIKRPRAIPPTDKFVPKAEKIEKISVSDKKAAEIFKPILKKTERSKAQDLEYLEENISEDAATSRRRFLAVSRNIALIQDMVKKKRVRKGDDFYEYLDEEDDYLYDEPPYEIAQRKGEDFGVPGETGVSPREMTAEYSPAGSKTSTFTSPDILEEHSRQLRGQVIVFVKHRLHVFEIDLQHIESNLVTVKKKIEVLEKNLKELGEKLMFMDANFSQRGGDLAALKDMAENHQVSIVTIMHHLDRKAEAYAVNQKVSRNELTVIEDRVIKLCVSASSEISKLEEKLNDSLENFSLELDKKLFTKEFEVRLEFLLHKIKMLNNKIKDSPIECPALDFDGIRPVEIKKFVLCKDGTRLKEARKKIATWRHRSTTDDIIPVLTQHFPDREASPKTAIQIQNELEQASIRESKRYAEGAYTKIQVGKK